MHYLTIESEMTVVLLEEVDHREVERILGRYRIELRRVSRGEIPGSYWGDPEAGLVGDRLYARGDTPLHSVLHESAHIVCMSPERRSRLYRDAGGDDAEENAVCYLQVLLSDHVGGVDRSRMFRDMDAWGYSFRLGSTRLWFEKDATEAREWLENEKLIDATGAICWVRRGDHR